MPFPLRTTQTTKNRNPKLKNNKNPDQCLDPSCGRLVASVGFWWLALAFGFCWLLAFGGFCWWLRLLLVASVLAFGFCWLFFSSCLFRFLLPFMSCPFPFPFPCPFSISFCVYPFLNPFPFPFPFPCPLLVLFFFRFLLFSCSFSLFLYKTAAKSTKRTDPNQKE